jgi:outer membrane receptor for ferric coprogen and ferric-rhodotorulic acid
MMLSRLIPGSAYAPSLLAVGIALALHPGLSIAAADTDDTIIVEGTTEIRPDAQQQDYSVKTTTTGTKLLLVQRDIPQSVSVISQQRMQDQELNTIEQVLDNTTGVSASRVDTHRTNFYSRGFSSATLRMKICQRSSITDGTSAIPLAIRQFMTKSK